MRVLILGATGLLGKALQDEWMREQVFCAGSREADIRKPAQLRALFAQARPDWTVLAAAYTDVDGCERNPELAHQVNTAGAVHVARVAREFGSRLLLLSTNYVFDGSKGAPYEVDDPIRPINVYGRTKAEAEAGVREILLDCCIVRTSWLFGTGGKCFPNTILGAARQQKELAVVADQRGCPTYNRDLARAIAQLTRAGTQGTVHATNAGDCTWFEFAREILRQGGLNGVTVRPTSTRELGRSACRPAYSVLSARSLEKYGIRLRNWREALRDYLAELPNLESLDENRSATVSPSFPWN